MGHKHLADSRKLCVKYEFLKRSTYREAYRNVCEMLLWKAGGNANRDQLKPTNKRSKSRKPDVYALNLKIDPEIDSDSEKFKEKKLKTCREFNVADVIQFYEKFHREEFRRMGREVSYKTADCLELLLLNNAREATEYRLNLPFPMKRVIVSRAYGKVKIQMLHPSKPCQNAEYWRCENSGCIIWRGYHVRMDESRRFQQMASADLAVILNVAILDEVEYRTEDHNSWNPNVDPFFNFVKYMERDYDTFDGSIFATKVSIELGWFGDSDTDNDKQVKLLWTWLHDKHLKSIKFRKWTGLAGSNEVLKWEIGGSLAKKHKWTHLKELDIQDRNWKISAKNYIHCDIVHIHLETDKFLEFCDEILKTRFEKKMITFIERSF
ncbi:hypothetical protein L3Y34_003315 [Caenorhabditis briggsae]|uniref:Uncharacterized protein n=1 Tax=Caenorhabditis briggsae TaxID=6238 RepID=A0AAE9D5N8_CAEBR|nr:hypothetical protein L3Y34_003315 [Caenorhabditis briggsae]